MTSHPHRPVPAEPGFRTALLALDLQHHHLARVPAAFLPAAATALQAARGAGVPVIHVVLGFRPGHADAHPRNRIFGSLPPGRYTPDDPGAAIHPDVAPGEGEVVVRKNRVSAFAGNDLRQLLDARGIGHLVLAGVATSGIVLSTALQASDLDFRVTVLTDACADPDPALHHTLTTKVLNRHGDTLTTAQWSARGSSPHAPAPTAWQYRDD